MISAGSFHRQTLSCAFKASSLCALAAFFLFLPAVLAGQIHESDLNISSQAGKIRTQAEGQNSEARGVVHSVDIRPDAHTGDVNVSGKAGGVHTQAGGQNANAASAVGGVNVGGK
jgi:hypothetical protein